MNLSMEHFTRRLDILCACLIGKERFARILACIGVWQKFDRLRSDDRPFDRQSFDYYIEQIINWAGSLKEDVVDDITPDKTLDVEHFTGTLYSQCWVDYAQPNFLDTINHFERRLRNNGVDVRFIQGAKCLDGGCGGGRYSIALHKLGAAQVVGVDLGEHGLADAIMRRNRLGISEEEVIFIEGSVLALPEDWTNQFDFVTSNGVLHHTIDPLTGLREIFRVLRPGGRAFIYVYGSGGLHWAMVDFVRKVLRGIREHDVRNVLYLLDLPVGKIFHIMDHWFVPLYEQVTKEEFERRLADVGFTNHQYLPRGLFLYDSSERMWYYPEDRDLMGEGDLRYLVCKPS